jgi:hypothetical protein
MKNVLILGLFVAVAAGCSKSEPKTEAPAPETAPATSAPAAPSPRPAANAPIAQPAPVAASPAAPPKAPQAQAAKGAKPLEGRVDPHMTALLGKFVAQKGRLPESVLELAGATSDGFPLAPAGFIYAIDYTSSQVKLVKQ